MTATADTPAPAAATASPWQSLRDYHAAQMRRYTEICAGFSVEQVVAPAIAISVHQAHERALAKMNELEAAAGGPPLAAGDRALIVAALEEAADDRAERAQEPACPFCADMPGPALCSWHREQADRAREYRDLAARLAVPHG